MRSVQSRVWSWLPFVGALGLCLAGGSASGADRTAAERLKLSDDAVASMEGRVTGLSRDYSQRRGLIGAEEAITRYEEGVYAFLIGEYERSAMTFFTIVESQALSEAPLARDSEWYLAESLFELGNWTTAISAYDRIIGIGATHPFFADSVRRELEIYGILRDNEKFYALYTKWILSGSVPATDAVKYTVAKSFFRQHEWPRAKAMITELGADSEFYGRARYLMGAILAAEGEFQQAAAEFEAVASRSGQEDPRVLEQAWLALGRVYYELGQYGKATEYYQRIQTDSPYYADELYEIVWTYIKQGQWNDALRQIEVFLIVYPQHAYTMQLRLIQGHLYVKSRSFDRALFTYQTVVETYTPLKDQLAKLEAGRTDSAAFFQRFVDEKVVQDTGAAALPPFAVQMLVSQPEMGRMVVTTRDLAQQKADLDESRALIREIEIVLGNSGSSFGSFASGRGRLSRVQDDVLAQRATLLTLELDVLSSAGSESVRGEVKVLRRKLAELNNTKEAMQGVESARSDSYQTQDDQVRAVQEVAARTHRESSMVRTDIDQLRGLLVEKKSTFSSSQLADIERQINELQTRVEGNSNALDRLHGDGVRRRVMSTVTKEASGASSDRSRLVDGYEQLHQRLRSLASSVTDSTASSSLSGADELWRRVADVEARAIDARRSLDSAERDEIGLLRRQLAEQTAIVETLEKRQANSSRGNDDLASRVTRTSFGRLEAQLFESIQDADVGVVDVFWLRKTTVTDQSTILTKQRSAEMAELDAEFNIIRQKLEN